MYMYYMCPHSQETEFGELNLDGEQEEEREGGSVSGGMYEAVLLCLSHCLLCWITCLVDSTDAGDEEIANMDLSSFPDQIEEEEEGEEGKTDAEEGKDDRGQWQSDVGEMEDDDEKDSEAEVG